VSRVSPRVTEASIKRSTRTIMRAVSVGNLRRLASMGTISAASLTIQWAKREASRAIGLLLAARRGTRCRVNDFRVRPRIRSIDDAVFVLLNPERLCALSEHYLEHRFDLLGSGWVVVKHGMKCRGLEEHRYRMGGPVDADSEGEWLVHRINKSNIVGSKRAWKLVDDGYSPIDWHLDFKSGYRWDESTWATNIKIGHLPGVDVKVPWELARMQHLPQLALAHGMARRSAPGFRPAEVYVREFQNQILDFIANNPPGYGVNWTCAMDVGIRAMNWLIAYDIFRATGAVFAESFEEEFGRSIFEHGRHIVDPRFLEWRSSVRGNHYLADLGPGIGGRVTNSVPRGRHELRGLHQLPSSLDGTCPLWNGTYCGLQ
jgi:hypothetical protein